MDIPEQVPSVDLADLASDDARRLDRAAAAIREGFGTYGLITIAGHDLAPERLEACHRAFVAVTDRPTADKQAWHRPDLWHQRGWTPPNTERAVVAGGQPDFKECWFAAPLPMDPDAAPLYPEIFADNLWPDDGGKLDHALTDVGTGLHGVGRALLQGAERTLGLDEGALDALTQGAAHVTRALRYLPVRAEQLDAGVLWGEEHTDFNLITVLGGGRFLDPLGQPCAAPDDRSGLYLRTRPNADAPRGLMVRGRPPSGQLVAQVGQQLEILTGGVFQATPHVIKAPRTPGYTRTSIAHFVHVHPLATLRPLAPFRTLAAVDAYRPPVLAGTYAIKTLVDIGLAPPTALAGLGYRQYERLADIRARGEW